VIRLDSARLGGAIPPSALPSIEMTRLSPRSPHHTYFVPDPSITPTFDVCVVTVTYRLTLQIGNKNMGFNRRGSVLCNGVVARCGGVSVWRSEGCRKAHLFTFRFTLPISRVHSPDSLPRPKTPKRFPRIMSQPPWLSATGTADKQLCFAALSSEATRNPRNNGVGALLSEIHPIRWTRPSRHT